MTLSVDTNLFVEVLRGRSAPARQAFGVMLAKGEPVVASIVVHHELLYGAALHRDPAAERENVRSLIDQVVVEALDRRDMAVGADVRADLRRRGLAIGPYDLLIAGQALARGWTMVTNNVREFSRITGLKVLDWQSLPP